MRNPRRKLEPPCYILYFIFYMLLWLSGVFFYCFWGLGEKGNTLGSWGGYIIDTTSTVSTLKASLLEAEPPPPPPSIYCISHLLQLALEDATNVYIMEYEYSVEDPKIPGRDRVHAVRSRPRAHGSRQHGRITQTEDGSYMQISGSTCKVQKVFVMQVI